MATHVILSRFSPEALRESHEFKKLAEAVSAKINVRAFAGRTATRPWGASMWLMSSRRPIQSRSRRLR